MITLLAFAVGLKAVSAIAGIFLVGGGVLGYLYGAKVYSKAEAGVSQAKAAISAEAKKL